MNETHDDIYSGTPEAISSECIDVRASKPANEPELWPAERPARHKHIHIRLMSEISLGIQFMGLHVNNKKKRGIDAQAMHRGVYNFLDTQTVIALARSRARTCRQWTVHQKLHYQQ